MLPQNDYLISRDVLDYRAREIKTETVRRRLLRDAGLARRPWLSCQICRSLYNLGRLLIGVGHRLEQRYAAAAQVPQRMALAS